MKKRAELWRVRFRANAEDPRPVNWPVKHPYWISGYSGDDSYAVVISYADDEAYIYANWPEATHVEAERVKAYEFTGRFPKPEWMTEAHV